MLVADKNAMKKQLKYAKLCKGKEVLELAGGNGEFLELCIKMGAKKIISIDIAPGHPKVKKCDIIKYIRKTRSKFDIIFARHILEHFPPSKVEFIMKQVYRILRKNGLFIIVVPNLKNLDVATNDFWREFEHIRPYNDIGLKRNLEWTGFKIVKSGQDKDSWDSSWYKELIRKVRSLIVGFPYEAPDYFIIAEKSGAPGRI